MADRGSASAAAAGEDGYFFIDDNRAYRGPVTKQTLHFLLQTSAISPQTYVFAEHLKEANNNSWVRLKRLPELLEELSKPLDTSAGPSAAGPSASASAAASRKSRADEAGPAAAAGAVPDVSDDANTTMSVPTSAVNPTSGKQQQQQQQQQQAGASADAEPPPEEEKPEPLYQFFPPPTSSVKVMSGSGGKKGFFGMLFGGGGKGGSSKGGYGVPVDRLTLSETGVPETPYRLREMLVACNGHLAEGIFRVSPSQTILKTAKEGAEKGDLRKVQDPESMATLIKLWFRAVPNSIFGPSLQQVVDGPPSDAAGCARLVDTMQEPQRATVRWLASLFLEVAQHESKNRMTIKSLAVVFAPNLVDPPQGMHPLQALELNRRVCLFLERLLEHEKAKPGAVAVS